MIKRLHELQSQEATSHFSATHTSEKLPQDSQAETAQTSGVTTAQQDTMEMEARNERAGESSRTTSNTKPTSLLGSAQKNGGRSSSSARRLPGFVYQVAPDSASRETEDMQGGRGGGGGKKWAMGYERKAKQKLNITNSSDRSGEDAERTEASEQPASTSSWSEMSSVMIGTDFRLSPLSPAMEQRLILQYLTPLGDYQEVGVQI